MDDSPLVSRITKRLEKLDITHSAASVKAELSKDFIRNIFRKPKHSPSVDGLRKVADVLECSILYLIGDIDELFPTREPSQVGKIGWVQAGELAEAVNNYHPGDAESWIEYPTKHSKMIALDVKGTSMNRVSPDGSTLIVDLYDRDMTGNRLYVVKIGDDEEVTYKRYRDNPPRLEPDSTDDSHKPINLEGKRYQAVGRVVRTLLDFD